MKKISSHYDEKYFSWQKSIGEFGGWANRTKFEAFISPNSDVLDFGCGGGYLLENLYCRKKIGVEPNPAAQEISRSKGIEVYSKTEDVPDEYCDVIISNNALEHVLNPLNELMLLWAKLKKEGKIIFVVPCESISCLYKPGDVNHHLYCWSPMCLGNLFTEAGFDVIESKPYLHKWYPSYRAVAEFGGRRLFEILCRIRGRIERRWHQVRIVATKKGTH